ncbi:meiotic recombination protein SPO11 [Haematococcus lacustris]|uniref:Meiotic recombination protein SPO11 n=1 Tax=Haematococcus lacustris TaxID=44745 RepID=A0A699YLQ4_HAELA|nr:meiotic recombination protein SPO11 [Haematococcus lacustris]
MSGTKRAGTSSDIVPSKRGAKSGVSGQDVLVKVRKLATALKENKGVAKSLDELDLPYAYRAVMDKDAEGLIDEIEAVLLQIAASIMKMYVPELDRIVLRDSVSKRTFASTQTCRKAAITTRILGLVHQLCAKRIHVTKRDLFYTDVKLFEEQGQSDTILEDLACMLGCTRSSLHGEA